MSELTQKVAVITGGSTGIGQATALALARDGVTLALVARNPSKLEQTAQQIRAGGGTVLIAPADVTQASQVERAFQKVMDTYGRVDVLVNNAGSSTFALVHESNLEDWESTLAVNLTGTYLCTRRALQTMLPQGTGQIVNVISVAAKVAFKGAAAYCAAKAGALAFTRVVAEEVRDQGIRVTALCPGSVATPFWEEIDPKPDLNLMQKPEDIAEVIRFVLAQPPGIVLDEIITTPPLGIL